MIDAYEIGIQLMLQEDVSAGLEVINRGLAEVDQAIAATSADLAGLVNEAETATKAVAVAVSGRAKLATTNGQKAAGNTEPAVPTVARDEAEKPLAASSGEKAAAPEIKAAEPSSPAKKPAELLTEAALRPQPDRQEQTVSSSAPVKSIVGEQVSSHVRSTVAESSISGQRTNKTQAGPEVQVYNVPAQFIPTAPGSSEFATPPPVREIAGAGQEPRRSVTPSATQMSLTASVSRAQRSSAAGAHSERAWHYPTSDMGARREHPVAPWAGVGHRATQAETTRLHEKAAAPQQTARNQNESTGGTVMLDGRLVGQWLAEHMAREASRPPVGTSFFDPRQTPAWNVSGAL